MTYNIGILNNWAILRTLKLSIFSFNSIQSKQTYLDCTIVHNQEEQPRYAYHVSDDKVHYFAFTSLVSRDLLGKYSEGEISSHPNQE